MDVDGDGTLQKCNYAYNHGGPDEAVEMLNRNLDLDIDGYVSADFYALADVVDALGGVEIDLTNEEAAIMNQSYIHFVEDVVGRKSKEVAAAARLWMVSRPFPTAGSATRRAMISSGQSGSVRCSRCWWTRSRK